MLNFWYSEQCSREMKLIICIAVCILMYLCSTVVQLAMNWSIGCLLTGFALHLLYQRVTLHNIKLRYPRGSVILLPLFYLAVLLVLIIFLPSEHKAVLFIQAIGFVCTGLFLLSIHENRAKRHE